jgi:hypothetical protein
MRVLVTGGTGFVGKALVPALADASHEITVVSRTPAKAREQFAGRAKACSVEDLPEAFDAVINLAGSTLDKRWTPAVKREMHESRVDYTRQIRRAAEERGARIFISASGTGIHGDRGDEILTEASSPGDDMLAKLCVDWEAAAQSEKMRVAIVRTSPVLHRDGGALGAMIPIFKLFLGGRLGNGRQWWPWIQRDDIVAIYRWALENEHVVGPVNGTSPNPVTNAEFTRALGRALGRPTVFPAPGFVLKLMLGEMAEMVLTSERVLPARTQQLGYQFKYPELDAALKASLA